ncbi:MAG: sulfide/dihydroorotate dehydrogenase-like FAD/NAD-binding protein [Candidatus Saelkia tenebricola]|nr:sulfide/dihydroorotate dehydrogenase-like FAD/NAD-binding protein [Candidatus Saelkia tenebricola]
MGILKKTILCNSNDTKINQIEVYAPQLAKKTNPGQFVVVMVKEEGERIPLTVVDEDLEKGSITLIFQEIGFSTKLLGEFGVGDTLYAILGPLGHATEIKNYGKVILVGGGVGIAEIYPVAGGLKEAGNNITAVIGARTKDFLFLENELQKASSQLLIATDDGSYGRCGFTTQILEELLSQDKYDFVYAVGPIPMMKRAALITKNFGIKTMVSLNALMVDATGMCGCCRVSVGDEVKFACIDGPEFDAHIVDWDELGRRNSVYIDKERHICNLDKL